MTSYAIGPDTPPSQTNFTSQDFQPRNALLLGAQPVSAARPAPLPPLAQSQLLRSAIGHAAILSDTPEKWAATIELLKQHGVDPAGYEDFEKGRLSAIAASGAAPRPRLQDDSEAVSTES